MCNGHGFDLWPANFHMPQSQPRERELEREREGETLCLFPLPLAHSLSLRCYWNLLWLWERKRWKKEEGDELGTSATGWGSKQHLRSDLSCCRIINLLRHSRNSSEALFLIGKWSLSFEKAGITKDKLQETNKWMPSGTTYFVQCLNMEKY